jgi:lysophospholipase L1-like esterase
MSLATKKPQYVTLLTGANDICQGFLGQSGGKTAFKNKIVEALRALTQSANPPAVIAVATIPRLYNLKQIPGLAGNSYCPIVWSQVCPNFSVGQVQFEAQWLAANQALEQAASEVGGPVVFDGYAVANQSFVESDVSMDCFHPSANGQGKIADAVWEKALPKIKSYLAIP